MIRFDATLLAAVSLSQDTTKNVRHLLCGVRFDGTTAVATDGNTLTAATDDSAQVTAPGTYPISKKARAAMRRGAYVTIDAGILTVHAPDGTRIHIEGCEEIPEAYPDWRRVTPAVRSSTCAGVFAGHLLARLCETAACLGAKTAVRIQGDGAEDPHLVRYGTREDVFSVVMPLRHGGTRDTPAALSGRPEWAA